MCASCRHSHKPSSHSAKQYCAGEGGSGVGVGVVLLCLGCVCSVLTTKCDYCMLAGLGYKTVEFMTGKECYWVITLLFSSIHERYIMLMSYNSSLIREGYRMLVSYNSV
jgi:hypothetical protein